MNDVLIVGGGAAGLATAEALRRKGNQGVRRSSLGRTSSGRIGGLSIPLALRYRCRECSARPARHPGFSRRRFRWACSRPRRRGSVANHALVERLLGAGPVPVRDSGWVMDDACWRVDLRWRAWAGAAMASLRCRQAFDTVAYRFYDARPPCARGRRGAVRRWRWLSPEVCVTHARGEQADQHHASTWRVDRQILQHQR